ncbi:MAG: alpha-L-rhamnosidase N-terminal domain-containing protein, partial [Niabella sp.]
MRTGLLGLLFLLASGLRANAQDTVSWNAAWIGLDKMFSGDTLAGHSRLSARYLRKEFKIADKTIKKATLYISGLGLYEAFINDIKTGDYVLAPTLTDYSKSVKYNTFDITGKIRRGSPNTIAVILGNGRYFSTRYEGGGKMRHFGFP